MFCDIKQSGVYQIKNLTTGDCYVGSAVCLKDRCYNHSSLLRLGKHNNIHLQRAFTKYGRDSFSFEIVELVENKTNLIITEQFYIDTLKPRYNICRTAGSPLGRKFSLEIRQKMSQIAKLNGNGKWMQGKTHSTTDETRQKISSKVTDYFKSHPGTNTGRKFTAQHKQNIRQSLLGRTFSQETLDKMSLAHQGNTAHLGHSHSDLTKQILRDKNLGRRMSEVTRKKISDKMKLIRARV